MFFKVLAAMVTADAFDRHRREQQRRAWIAADASRPASPVTVPTPQVPPTRADALDLSAPQRPL